MAAPRARAPAVACLGRPRRPWSKRWPEWSTDGPDAAPDTSIAMACGETLLDLLSRPPATAAESAKRLANLIDNAT